jgi:hypothetical protein
MEYDRIRLRVDGCPINLTCYAVDGTFLCKADNIPPDLWATHATGATRDEAQRIVLEQARRLVAKSRGRGIPRTRGRRVDGHVY